MSRSYRKTPILKDPNNKWAKRKSNKRVRNNSDEIVNGNHYKKLFCSYDICDFKMNTGLSFKEWLDNEIEHGRIDKSKDWRECYKQYRTTYLKK
jgi:hypothetical protein